MRSRSTKWVCSIIGAVLITVGITCVASAQKTKLTLRTYNNLPFVSPEQFKEQLEKFEAYMAEKGTPVKVEFKNFMGTDVQYTTKSILDLRAGRAGDVLLVETGRGQRYMRAGYLSPLDKYVEKWKPWEKVIDVFKERMKWQGHVYMIPLQSCSIPLYYRKDLFKEAGLNPEWQPRSWDDIIQTAEKIKAAFPGIIPLFYTGGKEAGIQVTFSKFNVLMHGAGETLYDEDEEKWIVASEPLLETLEVYEEITKKGLIDPNLCTQADADFIGYKEFSEGKVGIYQVGSWAYDSFWGPGRSYEIPNREKIVGYAKVPSRVPGASVRGQDFVNQSGGWNWAIPPSSKNKDLAWELIKFLCEPDRLALANASRGQVAVRRDVINNPIYQANKFLAEVSEWLKYTYIGPCDKPGYFSITQPSIARELASIMRGEKTALEAMKSFAVRMEINLGADKIIYKYKFE